MRQRYGYRSPAQIDILWLKMQVFNNYKNLRYIGARIHSKDIFSKTHHKMGCCQSTKYKKALDRNLSRLHDSNCVVIQSTDLMDQDLFQSFLSFSEGKQNVTKDALLRQLSFKVQIGKLKLSKLKTKVNFEIGICVDSIVDSESQPQDAENQNQIQKDGVSKKDQTSLQQKDQQDNKETIVQKDVQNQCSFRTKSTPQACHEHLFSEEIQLDLKASLSDLRNKFLRISILKNGQNKQESQNKQQNGQQNLQQPQKAQAISNKNEQFSEEETIATYRIDFMALALGPINHHISMVQTSSNSCCQGSSSTLGILSCDIVFSQTQKVEVQMTQLQAVLGEKNLKHAYQSSFNVVTFGGVSESNKSFVKNPQSNDEFPNIDTKKRSLPLQNKKMSKNLIKSQTVRNKIEWSFKPIFKNNLIDVVSHLDQHSIFEKSQDSLNLLETDKQSREPPFCLFNMQMGSLKDSSLQVKIWEDKKFKDKRRKSKMMSSLSHVFNKLVQKKVETIKQEQKMTKELKMKEKVKSTQLVPKDKIDDADPEFGIESEDDLNEMRIDKTPIEAKDISFDILDKGESSLKESFRTPTKSDFKLVDQKLSNLKPDDNLTKSKLAEKRQFRLQSLTDRSQHSNNQNTSDLNGEKETNSNNFSPFNLFELSRRPSSSFNLKKCGINRSESLNDYHVVKGGKATGDATDIYKSDYMISPYVLRRQTSVAEVTSQNSNSSPLTMRSEISHNSQNSDKKDGLGSHKMPNEGLVGECHISFEKLLKSLMEFQAQKDKHLVKKLSSTKSQKEKQRKEVGHKMISNQQSFWQAYDHQREERFEEILWFCGQKIGTISGRFRLINFPFLEQMQIGVMSNKGVRFSSKPLLKHGLAELGGTSGKQHKVFSEIVEIKNKLIRHDRHEKIIDSFQIVKLSLRLNQLLQISDKVSMTSFIYQNEIDLMKAQEVFLEMGQHCLEFVEFVNKLAKENYYQILNSIMLRSELDLAQLMIEDPDNMNQKIYRQKVQIAVDFQTFMVKLLKRGVLNFYKKGVESYKHQFMCNVISQAFFRIPSFRNCFLNHISAKSIEKETNKDSFFPQEAHAFDQSLSLTIPDLIDLNPVPETAETTFKFFDWDQYLYSHIPPEKSAENNRTIEEITKEDGESLRVNWATRLRKRGNVFFQIAQSWIRHVRRVLYIQKAITWNDIPGYQIIAKALLEELQERNIHFIPDALIEACKSFLSNPKLLNPLVKMVFLKTNAHDGQAVLKTCDIISRWFLKLFIREVIIPADFDFSFFFKGVFMLIDMDHSSSTAKGIWLLFQMAHCIPKKERDQLFILLLNPKRFYSLFFHWSWLVRRSFHYFFYFQLHRVLIDNHERANDMQQSMRMSLSNLGIECPEELIQTEQEKDEVASKLQQIPLHENLPKSEFKVKEAPQALEELKFVDSAKNQGSVYGALHSGKNNRMGGNLNSDLYNLFKERTDEVQSFRTLCVSINQFLKRHKAQLVKKLAKEEPVMVARQIGIRQSLKNLKEVENDSYDKLLEVASKQASMVSDMLSCSENQKLLETRAHSLSLQRQKISVNMENIANATIHDLLENEQTQENVQVKHILTEGQRMRWNQIIEKVPKQRRIYIKNACKQLSESQKDYQDWMKQNTLVGQNLDEQLADQDYFGDKMLLTDQKDMKISEQGFEGKPNFPKLDIRLPEDLREMETPDGDW